MIKEILLIVFGFVLLIKGADWLVDGASALAKKFKIPEIIIGLTIVSIGTSMPELFVSTASALEGSSDMALGNIIGSNICNLLLILGLSTLIQPVLFQKETKFVEIPMCLTVTGIFMLMCNTGNMVSRIEGFILIALFICFIIYTILMAKKQISESKNEETEANFNLVKCIVTIVLGIICLKLGGDFTVDNATLLAERFNVSEKIIGLTILAIGTSLPELVTSVTAAIKGNSDIAIGNIIGSNIFNILLIIGVSSAISPLTYNVTYNTQFIILMIAMVSLFIFPFIPPKDEMSRTDALVYLGLYILYMVILFVG